MPKEGSHIENVRLVRDGETGLGKGFGYVLFKVRCSRGNRYRDLSLTEMNGSRSAGEICGPQRLEAPRERIPETEAPSNGVRKADEDVRAGGEWRRATEGEPRGQASCRWRASPHSEQAEAGRNRSAQAEEGVQVGRESPEGEEASQQADPRHEEDGEGKECEGWEGTRRQVGGLDKR